MPFGNFKNPSEIFSSFVIAAICQGARCHSTYDKTMLAATPEVPKGITTKLAKSNMQVTAQLNNLRISPRKVRLVARVIKGMDAMVAKHQLDYIIKKSSNPISKLLNSAMANGYNSFGLVKENLFIKDIVVNEGPKLKRFRPKGFGMASPIEKKTSHIKIVLEEKVPGLKAEKIKAERPKTEAEEETIKPQEVSKEGAIERRQTAKPEIKKEIGKKGGIFGQVGKIKKFFRRKAI